MIRQTVILVGGRGTRLGDAARDYPKPLVPIAGDRRFLDYLIENLARHGVEEILLMAGHLADRVAERYHGRRVRGAQVHVIAEPAPAGTAGALRYAADRLDDLFLMANGDAYFNMNYLALGQVLGVGDVGAMALRRMPDATRYGRVETNGDRVTAFYEKDSAFRGEALISAGTYLLRGRVLDYVGEPPCSIEFDIFPKLAQAGLLAGAEFDGYMIDIGLPETLAQGRDELPKQTLRPAVFFDRDGTLTHDDDGYTHKPEALRWQPGAIEAIRRCNDAGRLVIVVTNQSGVARGLYDEAAIERFHAEMQRTLRAHGAHVDAFYYCPYHGEGVVDAFKLADHPDRKPNPGMLRRAMLEWPIDGKRSFLVGDTDRDAGAAKALGLAHFLVKPGELREVVDNGLNQSTTHTPSPRVALANEIQRRARNGKEWLFEHALPLWWDHGFDRAADCFHERLALNGAPVLSPRRIRVQARQTLVYARTGRMGWDGPWREAVQAGARVLVGRGLRDDGGTRHLLDANGMPADDSRDLYDTAFVALGLAEAAQALGERDDLLDAASALVAWTETHWAHPAGGFHEGDLTPKPPRRQNPHMHWFEAQLALHEASGLRVYLDRAGAIAALLKTRLFDDYHGALPEYFDDDWRALPGEDGRIVEPGHAFEWSWLLHRWNALGGEDLSDIAERLRVHGELYGVDASGAIYDELYIEGPPRTRTSRLWPHTERIKASLACYERTRDPNAARAAIQAFDMLMQYCDTPTSGLWRDRRLPDGGFVDEPAPASSFYHIMMALFELGRVAATL